MATQERVEVVEQAAKDELIWARWFASHRTYFCDANRNLIDRELTNRELVLSPENINRVFVDLQPQLAVVNEADQKARQARIDAAKAESDAAKAAEEAAAKTRADEEAAGILPAEYTKGRILRMERGEYVALRKNYGDAVIENRVNGRES
jgi:hypothetical protein